MTILQIIFSIFGILFVIWLYALVLSENVPSLDLTRLHNWWHEYRQKTFFQKIRAIILSIFQFFQYIIRVMQWLLKALFEALAEFLFYIVLRGIWLAIKFIFHLLARIFD